jgi:hypothetical protein
MRESERPTLGSAQHLSACLHRTRSHVLNVLVVVGLLIAVSGWLLRQRALTWQPRPAQTLSNSLYGVLIAIAAASYALKRLLSARASRAEPAHFDRAFYWAHLSPALIAGLAVPIGLAYGCLVRPQLDAVAPVWVVPFALGFLCLPRRSELANLEDSS